MRGSFSTATFLLLALAIGESAGGRAWQDREAPPGERARKPRHSGPVDAVAFSPDGKSLASAGRDAAVLWWDLPTGALKGRVGLNGYVARNLTFAPDGKRVLVQRHDMLMRLYDLAEGKEEAGFQAVNVSCVSRDGRTVGWQGQHVPPLLVPSKYFKRRPHVPPYKYRVAWNAWVWTELSFRHRELTSFRPVLPSDPVPFAFAIALSDDGALQIESYQIPPDQPKRLPEGDISSLALRLTDTGSGRVLASFDKIPATGISLNLSPDARMLAVVYPDHGKKQFQLAVLEARTGTPRLRRPLTKYDPLVHADVVFPLAFSPDSRRLAYCGESMPTRMVDLWRGEDAPFREASARSLTFSPGGDMLACGREDGTVVLWTVPCPAAFAPVLSRDDFSRLWDELAALDGEKSYRAVVRLQAHPQQTVGWLRERWAKLAEEMPRLLKELDSARFAERQRASKALEALGDVARPFVTAALAEQKSSLERRRRLEGLLERLGKPFSSAAGMRLLRIMEVLEHIASTEARALLGQVAIGAVSDPVAVEARRILLRMEKRKRPG